MASKGCTAPKMLGLEIGANMTIGLPSGQSSEAHVNAHRRGLRLDVRNFPSSTESIVFASGQFQVEKI